MFLNEFTDEEVCTIMSFLHQNKMMIVSDILR
jgi:hypothetical protein